VGLLFVAWLRSRKGYDCNVNKTIIPTHSSPVLACCCCCRHVRLTFGGEKKLKKLSTCSIFVCGLASGLPPFLGFFFIT
jgi:hypothetical protein